MRRCLLPIAMVPFVGAVASHAAIVNVPAGHATLQAAIDAAAPGDTVLVAPGTYSESGVLLSGKDLTIGSLFLIKGDEAAVPLTVFDGGGSTILELIGTTTATRIVGLTWRNGEDGLRPNSPFTIEHCRVESCKDGIDYESGSGGICRYNVFDGNTDDGIDLDDDVDIVIEHNLILDSQDDGIEIRLQSYNGPTLNYVIRWNTISGSGEDGIQLIDYDGYSDRSFVIERNLILNSAMAGLGCMSGGNTSEDYEGASIPEPILLANNVFDGQNHGIAGGDSMTAINNIVINSSVLGMKNIDGGSIVSHTCAWMNGSDFQSCNVESTSLVLTDPLLNPDYTLQSGSPCIDAGTPGCFDSDGSVCDLGVFFRDQSVTGGTLLPEDRRDVLQPVRPNPFGHETQVVFELASQATVTVEIFDLHGGRVRSLLAEQPRGSGLHTLVWDGRTDSGAHAASGVYFCRLVAGEIRETRSLVILRGSSR